MNIGFENISFIALTQYAKEHQQSTVSLLHAAKRQMIPAFREKGIWKIGQ